MMVRRFAQALCRQKPLFSAVPRFASTSIHTECILSTTAHIIATYSLPEHLKYWNVSGEHVAVLSQQVAERKHERDVLEQINKNLQDERYNANKARLAVEEQAKETEKSLRTELSLAIGEKETLGDALARVEAKLDAEIFSRREVEVKLTAQISSLNGHVNRFRRNHALLYLQQVLTSCVGTIKTQLLHRTSPSSLKEKLSPARSIPNIIQCVDRYAKEVLDKFHILHQRLSLSLPSSGSGSRPPRRLVEKDHRKLSPKRDWDAWATKMPRPFSQAIPLLEDFLNDRLDAPSSGDVSKDTLKEVEQMVKELKATEETLFVLIRLVPRADEELLSLLERIRKDRNIVAHPRGPSFFSCKDLKTTEEVEAELKSSLVGTVSSEDLDFIFNLIKSVSDGSNPRQPLWTNLQQPKPKRKHKHKTN